MRNEFFSTRQYIVSFFGHRKINEYRQIEKVITEIVIGLSEEKPNIEFWVGRNGDFDIYCTSLIKRLKKEKIYRVLTLALLFHILLQT